MPMPRRRLSRGLAVITVLATEVAAVVALYGLGRSAGFGVPVHHLGHWLRTAPTEVLVAAGCRAAGLAVASWLVVSTALSTAARVVPAWRSVRGFDLATPVGVRRLLDRTLAIGLGASLALSVARPAAAAPGAPVAVVTQPDAAAATADTPVPRVPPAPPPVAPIAPAPSRPSAAPRASPRADHIASDGAVVVRPGDNLWLIAQRAVGSDRPGEIAPYWRAVVAANAHRLRSHNPNLIYPGERIVLPRPAPPPG